MRSLAQLGLFSLVTTIVRYQLPGLIYAKNHCVESLGADNDHKINILNAVRLRGMASAAVTACDAAYSCTVKDKVRYSCTRSYSCNLYHGMHRVRTQRSSYRISRYHRINH